MKEKRHELMILEMVKRSKSKYDMKKNISTKFTFLTELDKIKKLNRNKNQEVEFELKNVINILKKQLKIN